MDLSVRERIASEVLGESIVQGQTMRCRFEERHSHSNGPRDVRVCLDNDGGKAPGFYCFHSSCSELWAPLNKELRRRIWFAENGRDDNRPREWDGVAPEPQRKLEGVPFDYEALLKMERRDWQVDEAWFRQRSPVDVTTCDAMGFLQHVYEPGERALIFTKYKSQGQFIFWHGKGAFRLAEKPGVKAVPSALPKGAPDGVWYLAQPVDGKWHENPRAPALDDGSIPLSRRAMESVTAWRFMVLECDHKEFKCPCDACKGRDNPRIGELWLNFLAQLPMPIVAIYTSAGKSVHALIRVESATKDGWDRYRKIVLRLFTKLGADPKAISAVRLTRLPGCLRGQRMQQLLYLNPRPDEAGTPIGLGRNVLCAHA